MKKTVFKFFALLSLAMFFAGCNNLLNDINDGKNDVSSKVTLKGSLALEGDAVPGEFLAMAAGGSARYAVAGGLMLSDYGFSLSAIETGTTSGENSKTINATVKNGNEFSITLDADKNYIFSLSLSSGDTITSGTSLTISRIMFGENEAGSKSVSLNGLTAEQLTSAKVYFSPDTTISGTGEIALEIDSTATNVNYVKYSYSSVSNEIETASDVIAFAGGQALINVTKATQMDSNKQETEIALPSGIYDFEFYFYKSDPRENPNDSPVAIVYQKINVFSGFVTDTWISDGSKWFSATNGVTNFIVSDDAINAYKNPKEFFVKSSTEDTNNSWAKGNDTNAGTSIKKPFYTLQKAIETVMEANDGESEYTIYVKGNIQNTTVKIKYTVNGESKEYDQKCTAGFFGLEDKCLNLSIVGVGDAMLSTVYAGHDLVDAEILKGLNLTLKNLTITDCVFNKGATITLDGKVILKGNMRVEVAPTAGYTPIVVKNTFDETASKITLLPRIEDLDLTYAIVRLEGAKPGDSIKGKNKAFYLDNNWGSIKDDGKIQLNEYKITYELNGGENSNDNPSSFTLRDNIEFAEPTRDGYKFEGWYETEDFTGDAKTAIKAYSTMSDIKLYAKWVPTPSGTIALEYAEYSFTLVTSDGTALETNSGGVYQVALGQKIKVLAKDSSGADVSENITASSIALYQNEDLITSVSAPVEESDPTIAVLTIPDDLAGSGYRLYVTATIGGVAYDKWFSIEIVQ